MNKGTLIMIMLALAFVLTACGLDGSNQTASGALTAESKLAVGTLRLENTDQAVNAKEAADLLPLWQLLNELKSSSSTAQEEVDAVVEKIQSTMTAEQVKAINEMALTQADVMTVSQGSDTSSSTGTTKSSSLQSSAAGGGPGIAAGGPPPDAGGMLLGGAPGGSSSSSSRSSTTSQSQTSSGTSLTSLIQQVIALLEKKMQN